MIIFNHYFQVIKALRITIDIEAKTAYNTLLQLRLGATILKKIFHNIIGNLHRNMLVSYEGGGEKINL
ncbi:MAG: hypothetical protein E6772_04425 [Dysgonomonas sp.]|nr:hypothetical protein [Dysgonomonas sp.]